MEPSENHRSQALVIESCAAEGYVLVRLPITLHHEALQWIFNSAVSMAKRDNVNNAFIDARGVEEMLTDWPACVFGDASQIFRDHRIRCAIVAIPRHSWLLKFIENVALNRGVSMRIFGKQEEAVAWLRTNNPPA